MSSNNYSSVLTSNSSFVANANQVLNSTSNNVQVGQTNSIEINTDTILDEKRTALRSLELDYLRISQVVNSNNQNNFKSDLYLENQNREISKNQAKLDELKSDILTLRRQIDIGENEFLNKSYKIFFLKHIFIFGLIGILVGLLYKNNNITMQTATMIIIGFAVFFSLVFFYNIFITRFRNLNDFHRMDWTTPTN
jgi:hypothetical protein